MCRIAAVLKLFSQLNKFSSNNLIRHGTKTVSVADVFLPHLTLTTKQKLFSKLIEISFWGICYNIFIQKLLANRFYN